MSFIEKLWILGKMTNFNDFHQNEHISMKLLIPMDFQKTAFYRLVYLHEKLSIFIKSPYFNEIKEMYLFH